MSEWEEEFEREFPNDHALVREVEERGALRERERIIKLLEELDDEEWMGINQNFIALIEGENE